MSGNSPLVSEPRVGLKTWYQSGNAAAGSTEILLYQLLLASSSQSRAELETWAHKVQHLEKARADKLLTQWKPLAAEWPQRGHRSSIFEPLHAAMQSVTSARLDQIGAAIQEWEGEGQWHGLNAKAIRNYLRAPKGEIRSKKVGAKSAPLRWQTYQVCEVAEGVSSSTRWRKLRAALAKAQPAGTRTLAEALAEELAESQARLSVLEPALAEAHAAAAKSKDAHRKAAARLKDKKAVVSLARAEERKRARAAAVERKEKAKRKMEQHLENALAKRLKALDAAEAIFDERLIDHSKKLAAARAKARMQKNAALLSLKRLKRAKAAEAKLKELQQRLDAEAEAAEVDAASPQHVATLSSRRNNRGRFEAEPWQMRPLKWAQLARRTPPSAINANITEVLLAYAPQAVVPQPCERQMRKLRGELALAGELIAAFRVAKCLRIRAFGFDESTKYGLCLMSSNTLSRSSRTTRRARASTWCSAGQRSLLAARQLRSRAPLRRRSSATAASCCGCGCYCTRSASARAAGPPTAGPILIKSECTASRSTRCS